MDGDMFGLMPPTFQTKIVIVPVWIWQLMNASRFDTILILDNLFSLRGRNLNQRVWLTTIPPTYLDTIPYTLPRGRRGRLWTL
eukprot:scaffold316754_cov156-Cyclotella_meneghiniana.AAC.1